MARTAGSGGLKPTPNRFQVNIGLAIVAGIVGQLFWMALYYPVYFMYQEDSLDLMRLFGSFLTTQEPWTHLLGFGAVMGIGVTTAVAYAWILYILNLQSSGAMGFVFGAFVFQPIIAFVIPWTVGFLAVFTGVRMNNPDVALNQAGHGNANWDGPFFVLLAYLIYGLIVGAIYRHKLRDTTQYQIAYQGG
jgi:hypothetical protein